MADHILVDNIQVVNVKYYLLMKKMVMEYSVYQVHWHLAYLSQENKFNIIYLFRHNSIIIQ